MIQVVELEEQEAWAWLRRHDERVYSFVDATRFSEMRRSLTRQALAFERRRPAARFAYLLRLTRRLAVHLRRLVDRVRECRQRRGSEKPSRRAVIHPILGRPGGLAGASLAGG